MTYNVNVYFWRLSGGALRRCTSEIVAVQQLSNLQAYGRLMVALMVARCAVLQNFDRAGLA